MSRRRGTTATKPTGSARWIAAGHGFVRRRPTAAAAVIYLLLSFAMFAPALVPGRTLSASDYLWSSTPWQPSIPPGVRATGSNREQTDAVEMWQPFMQYTRAALPGLPLWNPYIMGGRPFHANLQSATLSPFSAPAYVLPFWWSLGVMAALKLFVASLGTFLLARKLGLGFVGSLLAGIVFGFSLWSVTWVSWTTMSVWALLPWVILAAEVCIRRPGPLPFTGLASLAGLQYFAGHPTSSFHMVVLVGAFCTLRVLLSPSLRRDRAGLRLLTLAGGFAAGTALAAVTLLPFAELLSHSIDRHVRTGEFADSHAPARYLLGVFLHDWWGRGSRVSLEFASALEEHAYYVAALPLMLAAAALVLRPTRARLVAAGIGVGSLAIAAGIPPLFSLVQALPGFEAVRNGRFAVFTVLCIALLAGWGLEDLAGSDAATSRRRTVLLVALGLLLLPVVAVATKIDLTALGPALTVASGFATPGAVDTSAVVKLASLLEWLAFAAAAFALLAARARNRLGAGAFLALAVALVVLDLFKAGMGYNPAIPVSHAEQPITPAIRFLQDRRPARFAGLRPTAPLTFAVPLTPSVAMRYGVYDARGYDYPVEDRYARLWRQAISPTHDCNYAFCPESAASTPRALRLLGLFGVKYLLQNRRDAPLRRLKTVYVGPDARIYENPGALPRAFLVDRQRVVDSGDQARRGITSPGFDPGSIAVTERHIAGLAGAAGESPPGRAVVTGYGREDVSVRTRSTRTALLVLTDSWFPGWKARVDGDEAPIERVDYLIRGVRVPAGSHRVEFSYEPASFRTGLAISLVALMFVGGVAAFGLWRRRSHS